jgi:secreted trypsin-like serine protease
MKAFIAIFVLVATVNANLDSRITGGTDAKTGTFKSFVAIEVEFERGTRTCGGYLDVKMDRVITAASCVFDSFDGKANNVRFAFGQSLDYTKNKIGVKDIYKTGAYDASKNTSIDDIAVILLNGFVTRTSTIEGQAFVSTDDKPDFYVGQTLTVCGFGVIDNMRTKTKTLKCTNLLAVPMADCTAATVTAAPKRKKREDVVGAAATVKQICTKNIDDKNACSGDFGAPVFLNNSIFLTAVGIISYFPDSRVNARCQDGHYVVSTQIGAYKTFLSDPAVTTAKPA